MTQAQPGDEGRRQAYLAALGIPLWSARVGLPGALPSAPLAFVPFVAEAAPAASAPTLPPPVMEVAAPAHAPAEAPAVRRPEAVRLPPAEGVPGAVGESASPGQGKAAPGRPAAGGSASLHCRVRPLRHDVTAVIALDEVPDLSGLEYRLLANIARALGADELPEGAGEVLRWPLNRNPALDHGHEAMLAWLAHALRLPPGGCVVFGEALAADVQAAFPDLRLRAAPSLPELLADPAAKRRLQDILAGPLARAAARAADPAPEPE